MLGIMQMFNQHSRVERRGEIELLVSAAKHYNLLDSASICAWLNRMEINEIE